MFIQEECAPRGFCKQPGWFSPQGPSTQGQSRDETVGDLGDVLPGRPVIPGE
jgi:hypothetical protein